MFPKESSIGARLFCIATFIIMHAFLVLTGSCTYDFEQFRPKPDGDGGEGGIIAQGGNGGNTGGLGGDGGIAGSGATGGEGGIPATGGLGGIGGSGGVGGDGGIAGEGGLGGTGGDGGFGGDGGTGGIGGAGGDGGTGGIGGQGGDGGQGGSGGGPVCGNDLKENGEICDGTDLAGQTCGTVPGGFTGGTLNCQPNCTAFSTSSCTSPPPTCVAGTTNGTVDNITASGAIETGYLLRQANGNVFYSIVTPTMQNFTGGSLPGQLVLFGRDGIQFDLKNGANPSDPMRYYLVDIATLPTTECGGISIKSQACLTLIAKSFRCQFPPYFEQFGCPAHIDFVEEAGSPDFFFQDTASGFHLLLVDLECP